MLKAVPRHAGLLAACLLITACLPVKPASQNGNRDMDVPMSSVAGFDAQRFKGRWNEVYSTRSEGAACLIGGLTFTPQGNGDATWTEGPCSDGTPQRALAKRVGPGRFSVDGDVFWVLWVDQSYSTAVVATPEGRAHVLSRTLGIKADKHQAALDILAWNGFTPTALRPSRRK